MNHFEYLDGEMHCEGVPLAKIAEAVGTPFYVYSTATLERHLEVFSNAFSAHPALGKPLVAYAVKANSNVSVLRTLGNAGAGADTVSEGEIRRALAAGIPPERIVFSGCGKTRSELEFAIATGVLEINVESEPELDTLAEIAAAKGAKPSIAIRINPDVGDGANAKITTGKADNKFGVSISEAHRLYAKAAASPHLNPVGLTVHIGSQITEFSALACPISTSPIRQVRTNSRPSPPK